MCVIDGQTASDLSANRSKRPFIGGRECRKEKNLFPAFFGVQDFLVLLRLDVIF